MTVDTILDSLPASIGDGNLISIFIICAGFFLLAGLLRLIFGRRGTAVKAVYATLDILVLYCIIFVLHQSAPAVIPYLPALPFATFGNGFVALLPILETERLLLCIELIDLIILVFLFGLLEDLLPEGKHFFAWLMLRILCILAVYVMYNLVDWIFTAILPGFILAYAPVILLVLLAVFLAVTVFKWLIGLILGVTGGPVLGAIYTFFISNIIGKQFTKAALSSGIIMVLLYLANHYNLSEVTFGVLPVFVMVLVITIPVLVRYFVSKLF